MHMARQLFKYNRVRTQERGVYYTKWREDEAGLWPFLKALSSA